MTTTKTSGAAVETDLDLFSTEALLDPVPSYRTLRDLGPVVQMTEHNLYGLFRYDQVRAALVDWEGFSSAQGIAMNPTANELSDGSLLSMDPPRHRAVRKVLDDALRPKYVRKVAGNIEQLADELVDDLMRRETFDGVTDFAAKLPVDIVMDLIGFPRDEQRDKILVWALGAFNYFGPPGDRQLSTFPDVEALMQYLVTDATPDKLLPDSFGQIVWEAADRGEITENEALMTMSAYACAGLDTTIAGVASTLWLLAENPDQWAAIRQDPKLIPGAFLEGVRLETPIQHFSRVTTEDREIDGVTIPEGARVLVSYGAANRDERHYPDPDSFQADRNPADTVGFGFGVHNCPGRTLASMEANALFAALAKRATTLELTGDPVREPNNITRGLETLPMRIS